MRRTEQTGRSPELQKLLQELGVTDGEETEIAIRSEDGGDLRVAMIHQTGHVYSETAGGEAGRTTVLARLQVEKMGVAACLEAAQAHFNSNCQAPTQAGMKVCDTPGCNNRADRATNIAPATFVSVCPECSGAICGEETPE